DFGRDFGRTAMTDDDQSGPGGGTLVVFGRNFGRRVIRPKSPNTTLISISFYVRSRDFGRFGRRVLTSPVLLLHSRRTHEPQASTPTEAPVPRAAAAGGDPSPGRSHHPG